MKTRKSMIRLSGLLKRIPEIIWLGSKGPKKKKTKGQKDAIKKRLAKEMRLTRVQQKSEFLGSLQFPAKTRKNKPHGEDNRDAPKRRFFGVPAGYVETNARYPLYEIRKAKLEKRRMVPQTKAANW